tara:strand:- start:766 stop:1650 length:885 start_codon:yes stop_codon:yes gene_type:complete
MAITETRTLPAQFIEDIGKDYAKQLAATTAIPVDTSKFAPTVAAQDPLQQRAATLAGTGVGAFEPFIQAAQQQATAAGTTLGGIAGLTGAPTTAQVEAYTSPYQQQVIDTTLAEFDRQRAIQEKSLADQAIASGAFGGGREGVQRAEFGTQSARDRAALEAQLRQQGFQQAMSARQQDIANRFGLGQAQLGLGSFQTGLASQVPQLQRADISTLGQVGAAQQAQAQAELDAARQAARTAAYEPLERLGFFGQGVTGLLGGYPAQYQFSSTPPASPLQTALGLGTGLAGIFGALR